MTTTEPRPDPDGAGERRLSRPPSDRYLTEPPVPGADDSGDDRRSAGRAVVFGAVVAVIGAIAIVVCGGMLTLSAGLLVVAVVLGRAVGLAVTMGSGTSLEGASRTWTAMILTVGGVALGQIGLWSYARTEGGVLSLPDYLAEAFGVLVPLQLLLAVVVAWWTTR